MTIKPLEWHSPNDDRCFEANTPFGYYAAFKNSVGEYRMSFISKNDEVQESHVVDSLELAKVMAEEHWIQSVSQCLSVKESA